MLEDPLAWSVALVDEEAGACVVLASGMLSPTSRELAALFRCLGHRSLAISCAACDASSSATGATGCSPDTVHERSCESGCHEHIAGGHDKLAPIVAGSRAAMPAANPTA